MRKYYFLLVATLASCNSANNSTVESQPVKAVFDVPALLGKNIDQIKTALGKPDGGDDEPTKQQLKLGINEWENSFKRDSTILLVTYNPKTRRVIDFFISTKHGKCADYKPLLKLASIGENESGITIEPIHALANPNVFTGVKAVLK